MEGKKKEGMEGEKEGRERERKVGREEGREGRRENGRDRGREKGRKGRKKRGRYGVSSIHVAHGGYLSTKPMQLAPRTPGHHLRMDSLPLPT